MPEKRGTRSQSVSIQKSSEDDQSKKDSGNYADAYFENLKELERCRCLLALEQTKNSELNQLLTVCRVRIIKLEQELKGEKAVSKLDTNQAVDSSAEILMHQVVQKQASNDDHLEESKELSASTATGPIKKPKKRNRKARKAKARQAASVDSDFDSYFDAMIEENKKIKYFDPKWSNLVMAVERGEKTFECKKC